VRGAEVRGRPGEAIPELRETCPCEVRKASEHGRLGPFLSYNIGQQVADETTGVKARLHTKVLFFPHFWRSPPMLLPMCLWPFELWPPC
jgi:hypothetical protein